MANEKVFATSDEGIFNEHVSYDKRGEIRNMSMMNAPELDDVYRNIIYGKDRRSIISNKRVFFKEDGTPFVFDSRGRRNTRFKGREAFQISKPMTVTEAYANNIKMTEKFKGTPMSHSINVLDSNGNVIHQKIFNAELLDPIGKFTDGAKKELKNKSMDYVLAHRIQSVQNELTEMGIRDKAAKIEIATSIYDNIGVATHVMDMRKNSRTVVPLTAVKPSHYNVPTVFDPMGMSWMETGWNLDGVLNDKLMSRHVRFGEDQIYLSLKGLGYENGNIDLNAVKTLFGDKATLKDYYIQEDGDSVRFIHDTNPVQLVQKLPEMTADEREAWMASLKEHEDTSQPLFKRETLLDANGNPIMEPNKLNDDPLRSKEELDQYGANKSVTKLTPTEHFVEAPSMELDDTDPKLPQPKYDKEMQDKLNAQIVSDAGISTIDDENQKRLRVTQKIVDDFGGYEAYQRAHDTYNINDKDIDYDDEESKYFKRISDADANAEVRKYGTPFANTDGSIEYRMYLQDTFDVHGNRVLADMRDGVHVFDDGEFRKEYNYFTPDMIHGEGTSGKPLSFINEIEDKLVLTGIGEKEYEKSAKLAAELNEHKRVINTFLDDLKLAKENNTREQIKLSGVVQQAFGLKTDTVSSMHAFTAFKGYLGGMSLTGHQTVKMLGADMQGGKAFNGVMSAVYRQRRTMNNSSVYKDIKQWNSNREVVSNERIDVMWQTNEKADDPNSMYITERERTKQELAEHGFDNEYNDRHYLLDMQDKHQRELEHIKESLDRVDHSNEQAKKKIMNTIHQGIVEGTPITEDAYNAMVAEENRKLMPAVMGKYSEESQTAIRAVLGDDFTAEQVKEFVANPAAEKPLPSTEGYAFHGQFQPQRAGHIPALFMKPVGVTYTEVNNKGIPVTKTGTELQHSLTDTEYADFEKWSAEARKVEEYNTGRNLVLNSLGKERFGASYSEVLNDMNAYRTANGKEAVADMVPQEMTQKKADAYSIKRWQDYQDNLETHNQVFRMQGDKSLYQLKQIHENGTVVAERLVMPATALDVQLNFEKDMNTIESIKAANKRTIPAEMNQQYELSEAQKLTINQNRSIAMSRLIEGAKAKMEPGRGQIVPLDVATMNMLRQSELIRLGSKTGEGRKETIAVANKRLVDIMGARAGWMLRKGMTEDVASNINLAMMHTVTEFANEGKVLSLASKNGVIESFDQEFEDRFTKHLHKAYFEFNDGGGEAKTASEVLIRDVGMLASQTLQEDDSLRAKVGTPEFMHHVQSETERMLNSAGGLISEDFPYYRDALNPNKIAQVLNDNAVAINSTSLDTRYATEDRTTRNPLDETIDKVDGTESADKLYDSERATIKADTAQKEFYVNDRVAQAELEEVNRAAKHIGAINSIPNKHMKKLKFSHAREYFGDAFVDNLLDAKSKGNFQMPNEYELMTAYKKHRLDGIETREQIPGYGYEMIKAMYTQDGFSDGFFHSAMQETLNPNITSVEVLDSYMKLGEAMPEMNMTVSVNKHKLNQLGANMADMVPGDDQFTLERTDEGIFARSTSTNNTFQVGNTTQVLGKERPIEQTVAFNAGSRTPDYNSQVSRAWTKDATTVGAPDGAIPLAMNSDYSVNRVTRSAIRHKITTPKGKEILVPGNVGYLSSSDVGTRAGVNAVMNGASAVGLDFETTGLLDNKMLRDRGLLLPTEVYMEEGKMGAKGWEVGDSKHFVLDIGNVTDKSGQTVRSIITDDIGKMSSQDLIKSALGEAETRTWGQLGKDERIRVMNGDAMGLVRNLAKYSNQVNDKQLDAIKDFRGYAPDSLDNTFKDLVHHATIGLDTLSSRATHSDLTSFMQDYGAATKDKILVMQNGGDADIPWANHFAQQAKVNIDTKPQMIEMMHLSRLLNPEGKGHSLEAQINRTNDADIKNLYQSGSHMADTDVKAMMKVFGDHYLSNEKLTGDKGYANVEWMSNGDTLVKLGSQGGGKIPHDMYTVQGYDVNEGMHELRLSNPEGNEEIVRGASLQELQRNVTNNYKGFKDAADATKFLDDLTFDDAREDINKATRSYDAMIRERNRAEGGGTNVGLERARERYNSLQQQMQNGVQGPLTVEDAKILQNSHMFADDYYEPRVQPNYSDRQQRAMGLTSDFFAKGNEDADLRQSFLGEVRDLQAAGVIDKPTGQNMIASFNNSIKQRAEQVGALQRNTVPGLVDLGTLNGPSFGESTGKQLTALTNTFEQTHQSLWDIAENFKPLTSENVRHTKNGWKQEAVGLMTDYFKQQGIMDASAGNRMEDAIEAVRERHRIKGDMEVDDLTKPLIQGAHADEMRQAFADARTTAMAEIEPILNERPDLRDSYERTTAIRKAMESQGIATDGMNFRMGSQYEGRNLPVTGNYAFLGANDLKAELDVLDRTQNPTEHADLWREIYNRATGDYDDALDAQKILGWDQTPDQYIHPYAVGSVPAGTKYSEMSMGRGLQDDKNDINRIRYRNLDGQDVPTELAGRATEYWNHVDSGQYIHGSGLDGGAADNAAREAISGRDVYEDEYHWDRPDGRNRPESVIETKTKAARDSVLDGLKKVTSGRTGAAVGLVAAGLGAAFVARQWSRGDMFEDRPGHNTTDSPDGGGHLKDSSPAYTGAAPSGGKTYLTDSPQKNMNIHVSARNPGTASQDQIGQALQQGMEGRSSTVNVHHQDDTSSINSEWLQQKFSQLLDGGFVN